MVHGMHSGLISSTPILKNVSVAGHDGNNYVSTQIQVYEFDVDDLSGMLFTRHDFSASTRVDGICLISKHNLETSELNFGVYLLVGANPADTPASQDSGSGVTTDDVPAGKIWLAEMLPEHKANEFLRQDVLDKNNILSSVVPELGGSISFMDLWTGSPTATIPVMPSAGSGSINISKPTRLFKTARLEIELLTMKHDIETLQQSVSEIGLSNAGEGKHYIKDNTGAYGKLTTPDDVTVESNIIPSYDYKLGNYKTVTSLQAATTAQGLYHVMTDQSSVSDITCNDIKVVADTGASGTIDSSIAINADPTPAWTAVGSTLSIDANGMHVFNGTCSYERASVMDPAQAATLIVNFAEITTGEFYIKIDLGATSKQETLTISRSGARLSSTPASVTWAEQITGAFQARLIVDPVNNVSKVYINGGETELPILSSNSLTTGNTNKLTIGTDGGNVSVATWSSVIGERPAFFSFDGCILGSVIRLDGVTTRLFDLLGRENDLQNRIRYEGISQAAPPVVTVSRYRAHGNISVHDTNSITVDWCKFYDTTGSVYAEKTTSTTFTATTTITTTTSGLAIGESIVGSIIQVPYYLYAITNGIDVLYMVSSVDTLTGGSLAGKLPAGFVYYRRLDVWLFTIRNIQSPGRLLNMIKVGDTTAYAPLIYAVEIYYPKDASLVNQVIAVAGNSNVTTNFVPQCIPSQDCYVKFVSVETSTANVLNASVGNCTFYLQSSGWFDTSAQYVFGQGTTSTLTPPSAHNQLMLTTMYPRLQAQMLNGGTTYQLRFYNNIQTANNLYVWLKCLEYTTSSIE